VAASAHAAPAGARMGGVKRSGMGPKLRVQVEASTQAMRINAGKGMTISPSSQMKGLWPDNPNAARLRELSRSVPGNRNPSMSGKAFPDASSLICFGNLGCMLMNIPACAQRL